MLCIKLIMMILNLKINTVLHNYLIVSTKNIGFIRRRDGFIFKEFLNTPQYNRLLNLPGYKFLLLNPTAEIIDKLNSGKYQKYQLTSNYNFKETHRMFIKNLKSIQATRMAPITEMIQQIQLPINEVLKSIRPIIDYNEQMSKTIRESYKGISEIIRTNPAFKIDWKKISEEAYQQLKLFDITLINLSNNGWVLPTYYMFESDSSALNYIDGLSDIEVNKRMVSFYIRADYKYLFKELDNLEDRTTEGFSNQVKKVKNILKADMENYTVCMPVLFTLLDGMYIKALGAELDEYDEEPDKVTLSKYTLRFVKEHHLGKEEGLSHTKIILKNMFISIEDKLANTNFKNGDQHYSRHSVLHGAMSPDNYPFIEFIKLVNLCSLFALIIDS